VSIIAGVQARHSRPTRPFTFSRARFTIRWVSEYVGVGEIGGVEPAVVEPEHQVGEMAELGFAGVAVG
jgi:hypothetical protein